jgi:hypothetical protein
MSLAIKYQMKKKCNGGKMAEGGKVKEYPAPNWNEKGVSQPFSSRPVAEDYHRNFTAPENGGPTQVRKDRHRAILSELRSMPGPTTGKSGFAEGGMACKACGYSEGGEVANDTEATADFMPNEFDDLHLRDGLDGSYDSKSEMGDEQEDEDRRDMVSRIMASRRKRAGSNPRPA